MTSNPIYQFCVANPEATVIVHLDKDADLFSNIKRLIADSLHMGALFRGYTPPGLYWRDFEAQSVGERSRKLTSARAHLALGEDFLPQNFRFVPPGQLDEAAFRKFILESPEVDGNIFVSTGMWQYNDLRLVGGVEAWVKLAKSWFEDGI